MRCKEYFLRTLLGVNTENHGIYYVGAKTWMILNSWHTTKTYTLSSFPLFSSKKLKTRPITSRQIIWKTLRCLSRTIWAVQKEKLKDTSIGGSLTWWQKAAHCPVNFPVDKTLSWAQSLQSAFCGLKQVTKDHSYQAFLGKLLANM